MEELITILNSIYQSLNDRQFDGTLPDLPIIPTVGKNYLACCKTINEEPRCIYLSIDNVKGSDPTEEITAAVLHEMVHAYCILNGIPHYDQKTGEHLSGFVKAAKEHGLYYDDFLDTNFLL